MDEKEMILIRKVGKLNSLRTMICIFFLGMSLSMISGYESLTFKNWLGTSEWWLLSTFMCYFTFSFINYSKKIEKEIEDEYGIIESRNIDKVVKK